KGPKFGGGITCANGRGEHHQYTEDHGKETEGSAMSKNSGLLEATPQCRRHLGRNCALVAVGATDPGRDGASPSRIELPGKSKTTDSPPASGWPDSLPQGTLKDSLQRADNSPVPLKSVTSWRRQVPFVQHARSLQRAWSWNRRNALTNDA